MGDNDMILPFALSPTLIGAAGAAVLVVGLGVAVKVQTSRLASAKAETVAVQAKFDSFVAQAKAAGEAAKQAAAEKEKNDAKRINNAVSSRDAALAKLRQSAANPPRRDLSDSPKPAAGSSEVCLGSTAYAAALASYRERLAGLLGRIVKLAPESDAAQIDAKSLLESWPKN